MYYKVKKISNISTVFQISLFRHYRRILAPLNPISGQLHNLLILVVLLILIYALIHSTFTVFGCSLLWAFLPWAAEFLWYTPISLTFWIFAISIAMTIYSLRLCLTLPAEFRLLLLIDQGLSLRMFLVQNLKYSKKITLLFVTFLVFFFFCPKLLIIIIWSMPLLAEYALLTGLTSSYLLTRPGHLVPTQNFANLLGFDYNYLTQTADKHFLFEDEYLREWSVEFAEEYYVKFGEHDTDTFIMGENDLNEFDTDYNFEEDDSEDDVWTAEDLIYNRRISKKLSVNLQANSNSKKNPNKRPNSSIKKTLASFERKNKKPITFFKQNYPEFSQLQDMSLSLKSEYKKVPALYRYLKSQKEVQKNYSFQNHKLTYTPVETRLWTNYKLNLDVLKVPNNLPWHNSGTPQLFEDYFSMYEELSEELAETKVNNLDIDSFEPEPAWVDEQMARIEVFGGNKELEEFYNQNEPGSGTTTDYSAPNWFWMSFCYYTLGVWFFFNLFCLSFFIFCGIPEQWVLTTRSAGSHNWLLYKTLLHMTEQLYTKWGFTKLPVGNYCRMEYFEYMQPSYFRRVPKVYKKLASFRVITRRHPWQGLGPVHHRIWKRTRVYGIAQGTSLLHRNPKFKELEEYALRGRSISLSSTFVKLNQNVGQLYINPVFFEKKDALVNDFYQKMREIQGSQR